MAFCLIPEKVIAFKEALKSKNINIPDLLNMTTEERTKLFETYAGENAKDVNLLFEKKLVLKNKLQGIKNWASKIGEIGRYDPTKKAEMEKLFKEFQTKQSERIFSPKENEQFLADLAEAKMGTRITQEQGKTIFDLQTKVDDLKTKYAKELDIPKVDRTPAQQKSALEYGASKVVSENYVSALKGEGMSVKDMLKSAWQDTKQTWGENKPRAVGDLLNKAINVVRDNSVSIVATFDNSFLGRQGLHTLMTHPTVWWDMAGKSFQDIYKTLGGKNAKDALWADVYSRKRFINGEYTTAKLLPRTEEQFPTSLPGKIPGFGRIFKAADDAFTGSAIRSRIDLFDMLASRAEGNGVKMDKVQVQDLGTMINALTARGKLGRVGESPAVKLIFWAPRMLKANWDVLTGHTFGYGLETGLAKKEAAKNFAKIIGETATLMMVANAIKPGSAELDPTSTNFGKIKVGNTTFDYTGGAGSLIVLAARQITGMTKSTSTGVKSELGSKIGQTSRFDVLLNFMTGKTTPPVSALISWLKGKNIMGQKPTLGGTLYGAFTPITIQNMIQLKDDKSAEAVLGVILDGLGVNTNTYQATSTDWNQSSGKELLQFKSKVGDTKFQQANDEYNKLVSAKLKKVTEDQRYKAMDSTAKADIITKAKDLIKTQIFKKYHFTYQQPKKDLTTQRQINQLAK